MAGSIKAIVRDCNASKRSSIDRSQRRKRSGIYLESTEAEQLGVLPHECTRVKDAMSRSVTIVTPLTEIGEAVRLMKSLGVGAVIVCHDSMLVGTLSDRDIALANALPSVPIHKVMTHDSVIAMRTTCFDVHDDARSRFDCSSRPEFQRAFLRNSDEDCMIFLLLAPLIMAVWLSTAWSADVTPTPSVPNELLPDHPQSPSTPPPSRIDPGIERRPQTIPDPRSAVVPPIVDPKMAIDPEKASTAPDKTKPSGSNAPPSNPSLR
jgi:hypothetical protein